MIIQFGKGYWTFNMIAQQHLENGSSLEKNKHNKHVEFTRVHIR